jgi:hypothetical protein
MFKRFLAASTVSILAVLALAAVLALIFKAIFG